MIEHDSRGTFRDNLKSELLNNYHFKYLYYE